MNILLIGPPGVGKGTQAAYITKKYSLEYVTTGELLRKEAKNETILGEAIRLAISSGRLVSDDLVDNLVSNAVSNAKVGILFDGYPRTLNQAHNLDKILVKNNRSLDFVINMSLDDDTLIKRISGRFVCVACSTVYNRFFVNTKKDGICDNCGSVEFSTRSDDNEVVIKKRLEIFHKENSEILKYYKQHGLLVDIRCDASVEEISKNISYVIDKTNVRI